MAYRKAAVTPLLTHWSYCSLALSHRMMASSDGNIVLVTGPLFAGNSTITGEFLSQRPVTRSFDVFFDLYLNKRLSKQSRHRWFETSWRHYDVTVIPLLQRSAAVRWSWMDSVSRRCSRWRSTGSAMVWLPWSCPRHISSSPSSRPSSSSRTTG